MALSTDYQAKSSGGSGETPLSFGGGGPKKTTKTLRRVWLSKAIFLICLGAIAAILGFTAHLFLTRAETELAEEQFQSAANRALAESADILDRKRLGTITMASIAEYANPDASDWPFVTIEGYEAITSDLIETSQGREMGFCPLVVPGQQLADFEDFAYDYFERSRLPEPFPNGTGASSFGKGVYGVNPELNTTDNRYKETDGSTYYNSPNYIFAPILQHNAGPHKALMLNLHFQETRGAVIDGVIECSKLRATTLAQTGNETECGFVTDMLLLTNQEEEPGPGALLMQPIYPAHDRDQLTGVIASSIVWGETLYNVFGEETSGIDCVLETPAQVYTYTVSNGVPVLRGEGDLHDISYNKYKREIVLTGEGLFSDGSASYTLSLYPNQKLFDVYSTHNPRVAAVGAILIIFFVTIVFILYDCTVRQEFSAKTDMLKAKRKFVRFVSHEVRTPLNSVCMGLALMQEEIGSALGLPKDKDHSDLENILASTNKQHDVNCERVAEWLPLIGEVLGNARSSVDVLNDLLNYDKVEMGTLALELSAIPISHLIERAVQEFKLPALKKEIRFRTEWCMNQAGEKAQETTTKHLASCRVLGDSVRLMQVLRNLMSNALKFTPEKGDVVVRSRWLKADAKTKVEDKEFRLSNGETVTLKSAGQIQIAVKDNGEGLTEEQLEGVFEDGVQFNVNKLQAGQGSGLGLFIAKGIVAEHGGSLTVHSEGLHMGSTFIITVPLYYETADATLEAESDIENQAIGRSTDPPVESLSILVVDDAEMNRKLLSRLLENRNHVCDQARDGHEAIKMACEALHAGTPYDIILMDSEMPGGMDGPAATQVLRQHDCDSFIVGVTGNLLPEDVRHFKACGANDILGKPIDINALDDMCMEFGLLGRHPAGARPRSSAYGITPGLIHEGPTSSSGSSSV